MKFMLTVIHNRKKYHLHVEQIFCGKQFEHFRLTAGSRSVVLQSNRPLLKEKGLKYWKTHWRIIDGKMQYNSGFIATTEALDRYLKD